MNMFILNSIIPLEKMYDFESICTDFFRLDIQSTMLCLYSYTSVKLPLVKISGTADIIISEHSWRVYSARMCFF